MKFSDIPQFTRGAGYRINVSWSYLPEWLKHEREINIDLDPDFQRAHVWNEEQQRRYVEFVLRGGESSRDLYFNCVGWMADFRGPFVLVDGKQRMEAVLKFLDNRLDIFGGHFLKDFEGRMRLGGPDFIVHVNNLATRAEVLQWYIDLNAGGVAHTDEEIEKVQRMLNKEKKKG